VAEALEATVKLCGKISSLEYILMYALNHAQCRYSQKHDTGYYNRHGADGKIKYPAGGNAAY
jgi:hypothetical protein